MKLVVFDLDGTLLTGDTDAYWLRFLIDRGIVDRGAVEAKNDDIQARYAVGLESAVDFCLFYLSLLRGHARADLERWHGVFMRQVIEPNLPRAAFDLVREALNDGEFTEALLRDEIAQGHLRSDAMKLIGA